MVSTKSRRIFGFVVGLTNGSLLFATAMNAVAAASYYELATGNNWQFSVASIWSINGMIVRGQIIIACLLLLLLECRVRIILENFRLFSRPVIYFLALNYIAFATASDDQPFLSCTW